MKFVERRPYDSALVTIGAGAFILAIGLIALKGFFGVSDQSPTDLAEIVIGSLAAVGIILSGGLLLVTPRHHRIFGSLAITLSLISFIGTSGGLYIGAVAGILGGIMSISWHSDSRSANDVRNANENAPKT